MSNSPKYPSMQRMLKQLNKPVPNAGQYMSFNALCMILLLPLLYQTEKIAASDPSGYAPAPLIFSALALVIVVAIVEGIIAVVIFSGMSWMMNVPGFFAIGVIRGIEGAEVRYRNVHIRFYGRLQSNVIFSGVVLSEYSCVGLLGLISWISYSTFIGIVIAFVIIVLSAHILISFFAKKKRHKWMEVSDTQIRNDAELKRQKYPMMSSVPSVDEMEEILREAKLGDTMQQSDARLIDGVVKREYLKNLIWMTIVFISLMLLFV
ncbi:MAG: hypothetical protein ACXAC0_01480 [Candidatus Thorarchaeota archaeon]|jgi:hypothetical protein